MQDFLTNYTPLLLVDDESEEEVRLDYAIDMNYVLYVNLLLIS